MFPTRAWVLVLLCGCASESTTIDASVDQRPALDQAKPPDTSPDVARPDQRVDADTTDAALPDAPGPIGIPGI